MSGYYNYTCKFFDIIYCNMFSMALCKRCSRERHSFEEYTGYNLKLNVRTIEKFHEPLRSLQLVIGLDFERLDKHFERAKSSNRERTTFKPNLNLLDGAASLFILVDSVDS